MKRIIGLSAVLGLLILAGGFFPGKVQAAVPAPPTNLTAEGDHYSYINLRWTDNSSNETQFTIYRHKAGESGFTPIANVPANTWKYKDTGLDPDTTYAYKVRARNRDGYSTYSNQAVAETSNHPKLRILSPNGGEVWREGETHYITWTCDGEEMIGFIEYIVDDGPSIRLETAMDMDPGTYRWTIPNIDSDRVKILVAAYPHDSGATGSDWTDGYITIRPLIHAAPFGPPPAPSELRLTGMETVTLNWTDNSINETGFKIERREGHGVFGQIATVGANATTYEDPGLTRGVTYTYRVRAYNSGGNSDYSNEAQRATMLALDHAPPSNPTTSADPSPEPSEGSGQTILRFYIDSGEYYIKGQADSTARLVTMDTAPAIREGRTILPIRYVAEQIGADVEWDDVCSQVTIKLGTRTIVLWINNGKAQVNSVEMAIDPGNPAVTPIIVPPGRTMLPLRFITENLGCQVDWNPELREVKITYPKS